MYSIEITYRTGGSFGSKVEIDLVGYTWNDINDAKIALSYIKDHYKLYQNVNDLGSNYNEIEKLIKSSENKPWFDKDHWKYSLNIPGNSGETSKIASFWLGYFETLILAKIVLDDEELTFEP